MSTQTKWMKYGKCGDEFLLHGCRDSGMGWGGVIFMVGWGDVRCYLHDGMGGGGGETLP